MVMKMVDFEDPCFKGKSMPQVEKILWEKDVEVLRSLGVQLSENHMDGYQYQAKSTEKNLDPKPWEDDPLERLQNGLKYKPRATYTVDNWDNNDLKFEIENGIGYMTMNRPEANNTINNGIRDGIHNACDILNDRPDVRIATLTGNGRMFCAGADPTSMVLQGASGMASIPNLPPPADHIWGPFKMMESGDLFAPVFTALLYKVTNLRQFTVACLNGSAMAGGVGFLCICDMVIAVKSAFITVSEVKVGMIPATISPYVIGKMGVSNAKRFFCTADNLKVPQAVELGLVQQSVDSKDDFKDALEEISKKVQMSGPDALRTHKDLMIKTVNATSTNALLEYTAETYAKTRKGAEAQACMAGLREKKKPSWMNNPIVPRPLF